MNQHRCLKILFVVVCLVGIVTTSVAQDKMRRLAVVEMDAIFSAYFKTERMNTRLDEFAETMSEDRLPLVERYTSLQQELEKASRASRDTSLDAETRRERTTQAQALLNQLRELKQEIDQFDETRANQLDRMAQRVHEDLLDDILGVINDYAREKNIELVIDSSYQRPRGLGLVVHSSEHLDITDVIIQRLNKGRTESDQRLEAPPF